MSLLSARDLWVAPPAEGSPSAKPPEPVVRGFSLELDRGEWVALSGANGCGKTSLLLGLAGLWPLRSGEIRLAGEAIAPGASRRRIATILQDPSSQLLQPTVREELSFTALNLGRAEEDVAREVESWSAQLGLEEELPRDPQRLSSGRQQLVLLGAALVARPDLLLADEPAAHLDATTRERVLALIRDEVARGLSVLWVTQEYTEMAAADRVVRIGAPEPVRTEMPAPGPESPGPPLLTLRVAPAAVSDGPRIRVASQLVIRVPPTGVVALAGPNGVGKSVLLAVAAGLLRLDQVDVVSCSSSGPPPLLVTQYPELQIFEEKVSDEIVYAATCRGVPRDVALRSAGRILDRLGCDATSFLGRRTWSLSGGEKRLLSIAGALAAPALLLAIDEPTAGLDPGRRSALGPIIAESASRRALLLASQDREWLSGVAMRTYHMDASVG